MGKIIQFHNAKHEDPDLGSMDREELREYLRVLEGRLHAHDQEEPEDEDSEEFDAWADAREELEDQIDEILDYMDELEE